MRRAVPGPRHVDSDSTRIRLAAPPAPALRGVGPQPVTWLRGRRSQAWLRADIRSAWSGMCIDLYRMIQSQPAALRRAIRPCDRQSSLGSRSKEQLNKTNRQNGRAGAAAGGPALRPHPAAARRGATSQLVLMLWLSPPVPCSFGVKCYVSHCEADCCRCCGAQQSADAA